MLYRNLLGWLVWFCLFDWLVRRGTGDFLVPSLLQSVTGQWHKTPGGCGCFNPAWHKSSPQVCPSANLSTTSLRKPAEEVTLGNFTANKTSRTPMRPLPGVLCRGAASSLAPAAALAGTRPSGQTPRQSLSPVPGASHLPPSHTLGWRGAKAAWEANPYLSPWWTDFLKWHCSHA